MSAQVHDFKFRILKQHQYSQGQKMQPPELFYEKSCSLVLRNIHKKTLMLKSFFATLLKKDSNTVVFLWIVHNF